MMGPDSFFEGSHELQSIIVQPQSHQQPHHSQHQLLPAPSASVIMAPFAGGNNAGLNLSINHGLDLTCPPHYEGLNLSLTDQQNTNNYQSQQIHPQQDQQHGQEPNLATSNDTTNQQGLNLSSTNNASSRQFRNQYGSEVGLNLSIQNQVINLTSRQPQGTSSSQPRSDQYYYTTNTSGGYINLSAQKMPFETQPLNLEHRASPLNLTNANNQFFGYDQTQYDNMYQGDADDGLFNPDFYLSQANGDQNDGNASKGPVELAVINLNQVFDPSQIQPSTETTNQLQPQPHQGMKPVATESQSRIRLFCSTCCQEFASTSELNRHMLGHNTNAMTGKAPTTSWAPTPSTSGLVKSQTKTSLSARLPPEINNFVASTTNNSSKKNGEPEESCNQCSMVFQSGVDLKKHLDLVHSGRQEGFSFVCRICGDQFHEKSEHRNHVASHAKDRPFACSQCPARLSNQTSLNRHVKRIHDKDMDFKCDHCGKRFYDRHDLKRHLTAHDMANSVSDCTACGKSFSNQYQKDKHKCKGPEGKYPCELCTVKLSSKASWGMHMWKHTKDIKYLDINSALEADEEHEK